MSRHSERIIELLRGDYPDLSRWTIICAGERAVDPVQRLIHKKMGGILPKVEDLDSYRAEKIGESLSLKPLPGEERLLYFIRFMAEKYPHEPYPARRAASVLPLVVKMSEYNVRPDTLSGSERFTEEEWSRLEEYLDITREFREWLSEINLFMPELELTVFDQVTPGEKEIFIGLPEMTQISERFYRKISKERLLIDKPLFGHELAGSDHVPFDSAKNLVLSFGGKVEPSAGAGIEMLSLAGLHAVVDLVTLEVSAFLREKSDDDQLMIYLLDESLTSMLWYRSLRLFGNAVNLAVWLPFSTTSAGRRLLSEIEKAQSSGRAPDFKKFAIACAMELSQNREHYVREECEALETAISFSTLLDFWKDRLGGNLADAAKMLIERKKFRVSGSRSAPVQVAGIGHVSGERFSRGLILSLDSGIMPTQPFDGPFINPVHVPQLRRRMFEYEDLMFRQILALGEKIKIVGVNDSIRERTPSYYMSLLAQEFGKPIQDVVFQETDSPKQVKKDVTIRLNDDLRNRMKAFTYSFSSLTKILACPFLFYHQYMLGIKPPSYMDDEEKINMQMGNFIHGFLRRLSTDRKEMIDRWEGLFDELWKADDNLEIRGIEGINMFVLNAKIILREIYEDEKESGSRVIFADNAIACEKRFTGTIDGIYNITGFVDRLAEIAGRTDIIDFKYSKKQGRFDLSEKTTVLERFQNKGTLHPAAQLMIYRYFSREAQGARFYFLKESTRDRQMELPPKEITSAGALMRAIRERLDLIIAADDIRPNHDSEACEYCGYRALCGREGYYKAARRNV